MKIALVSSFVPFVKGGARNIVDWLRPELEKAGHEVETIWLPFDEAPANVVVQMASFRLIRLEDSCDRIVTFRPPAHHVPHPHKIAWFIHHIRIYYDLWGTPLCPLPDTEATRQVRATVHALDTVALRDASRVFSNSRTVSKRLMRFNGIASETLYPPVARPERFRFDACGDELLFVCRMEAHKRQHLAIAAIRHCRTPVRLRLCGSGSDPVYVASLKRAVELYDLGDRVAVDDRWIDEQEKIDLLAHALACVYLPLDEDSYGYPTLEAALARKPTLTTTDAGGVVEFVVDGVCGIVTPPDPQALADAFDRCWTRRDATRRLGEGAYARIDDLGIGWDKVVSALTAPLPASSGGLVPQRLPD